MRQDHKQFIESLERIPLHDQNPLFNAYAARNLTWFPELGLGYYPVKLSDAPYDKDYFERYRAMAKTPIGLQLTQARLRLVERHWQGELVDVGIGSGAFIDARNAARRETFGFDVNPLAVEWLKGWNCFRDINDGASIPAASFWDVLEHIPNFCDLLRKIDHYVFISIPIFRDGEHVRASKHYRKDEHFWYFTDHALKDVMAALGFSCVESNTEETEIGREDIGSYVFKRDFQQ